MSETRVPSDLAQGAGQAAPPLSDVALVGAGASQAPATSSAGDASMQAAPRGVAPPADEKPLPLSIMALYSLPPLGAGYMFLLISLFLMKFATDVLLIAPAAMGVIFMVSRIWDAVTDPVAGYLSDRTRTRFGRRRPWILAAAVPIGGAFVMMWSPPAGLSGPAAVGWMATAVLLFYTAMTAFIVPHNSLGAELTTRYHDRTRVFAVRQVAWNLGSFVALAAMYGLTMSDAPRDLARDQALLASLVTMLLVVAMAVRLRERPEFLGRGGTRPFQAFADVWRNPHARLLLFVFFVESVGGAVIGVLTIYYSEYVLQTPHMTVWYIVSYFVAATVSIPIWVPLSRVFGKKRLWFYSMIGTALGFGSTFLLEPGMATELIVIAAGLGLAAGCGNIVGPSIQADVIDYDDYRTGERKEGAYFAAWNFVFKSATGVTLGLTGFVLQASGFEPNAEQSEAAQLAIRSLYALFPLVCYVIGGLLFLRFSFDEDDYAEVRRVLDARGPGGGHAPPNASAPGSDAHRDGGST